MTRRNAHELWYEIFGTLHLSYSDSNLVVKHVEIRQLRAPVHTPIEMYAMYASKRNEQVQHS